jgi:hypothetical protein
MQWILTMQLSWAELVTLLALIVFVAAAMLIFWHNRKTHQTDSPEVELQRRPEIPKQGIPTRIVIGENRAQPVVTIAELQSVKEYEKGTPLDIQHASISRLTGLFQAVPSLLMAGEACGKRLMEVVISGDMARASDGNGLRAFAMGADGIKQHARLFELSNLQTMINAAAIWQAASVLVAQKHLADISKKLDEIKDGIKGISLFLDNQRKARIQSWYDYLGQAYQALQAGELPGSVRNQLENCEYDLLEIQCHLEMEYRQKVESEVKAERFGTR